MIVCAFAVAHEAAGLRGLLHGRDDFRIGSIPCSTGNLHGQSIFIAELGLGESAARVAAEIVLKNTTPHGFIMAGYAGALGPELAHAEVFLAGNYPGPWLEKLPKIRRAVLVTVSEIVTGAASRRALAEAYGAQAVDMETRAVSTVVTARGVPFLAVRSISDIWEDRVPGAALTAAFDPVRNRPTPCRLLAHFAQYPGDFLPFVKFTTGLKVVRKNLTQTLVEIVTQAAR